MLFKLIILEISFAFIELEKLSVMKSGKAIGIGSTTPSVISISNSGTLFLASHSNELLLRFCKRGLVFEKGAIAFDGPIKKALTFYEGKI